jgi:hypothetical protein
VAEAKLANLWKKSGPWQEYPQRMLMHRAAGFHFDDCWQDVLMGLTTVAVMQDHPQAAFIREGEAIVTDATPPGRDPLLPPASGAVVDVDGEELPARYVADEEEAAPSEINLGAYRETPTATEVAAQPGGAGSTPDEVPSGRTASEEAPASPVQADAPEKEEKAEKPKKKAARKKKPVPDQEAPFIATCSVDGCGKEFDPHREVHWNHDGVFRCSSCGQFPK